MNEQLQRQVSQMNPAIVRATLADGSSRDLKPTGGTRKRWARMFDTLGKLPWQSIELYDSKGSTLGIVDNPDLVPVEESIRADGDIAKVIIAAQREALTWQDKSTRSALDACVAVMKQLSDSVTAMSRIYQMQIDALADMAHAPAPAAGPDDDIASSPLIKAMMPMIMARLAPMLIGAPTTTKPPGGQPGGGSNGVKTS